MRPRAGRFSGKAVGIALLLAASGVTAPEAAHAEGGLFGAIVDFLSGRTAQRPAEPLTVPSPNSAMPDAVPGVSAATRESGNGPKVAYCVRTCDGRYFPIAKIADGATPAATCRALCPATETKIYSGSNIDTAYASDGSRYASLPNAYAYRGKLSSGCTCNGASPAGNARITIENDPTLRAGDIVMTANGPVVFVGTRGTHHKMSDFVPVQDSREISQATRNQLAAMKAMPTRPQAVATAETPMRASRNTAAPPDAFFFAPQSHGAALSYSEP